MCLPLRLQRIVQHPRAADLFSPQPELFSDKLFPLGKDELRGFSRAAQTADLPRLPPPLRSEQNALKAERPIGQVGQVLLDDERAILELRGHFDLHVVEAKLQRAVDAEMIAAHVEIEPN